MPINMKNLSTIISTTYKLFLLTWPMLARALLGSGYRAHGSPGSQWGQNNFDKGLDKPASFPHKGGDGSLKISGRVYE
jgi:hypothetical protein